MDKHILTNNKIIGDKPSQQLFPKQVPTQPSLLNQTNRTHRSVKIKTFENRIAPNIKQMKPQRKYRLGTPVTITGGINNLHPHLSQRYQLKKKTIHKTLTIYFYLFSVSFFFFYSQNITGSKEGSFIVGLIVSTPHQKNRTNKPAM